MLCDIIKQGEEWRNRFPKIVLATGYDIEDKCIRVPKNSCENIYHIKTDNSIPKHLIIDKIGERQEYFASGLDEEILIGLLGNEMEGVGFLPASKESQLTGKLYSIKGILPDWRKQMQIPGGEKQVASFQTVPYVTNRLSDMLGQKLETKKLRVGTAIAIPQSVQLTL